MVLFKFFAPRVVVYNPHFVRILVCYKMVASAIFITDTKGKVIISRNYRGDVPLSVSDRYESLLTLFNIDKIYMITYYLLYYFLSTISDISFLFQIFITYSRERRIRIKTCLF